MSTLPITLSTASILGILLIWLSARVIAVRVKQEVGIGDAGNIELSYRIRTHGNFTEYVPIFVILLGLLEAAAANQTALMVLAAAIIVSRVLHVLGMGENANLKLRQAGVLGTFTCIVVASLYGLYVVLTV